MIFEMPTVSFTKEFALEVVENNAGVVSSKFFTTVPRYTEENYNTLAPPYFSFYTNDENNDDKPEKIVFDISLHGITAANIRNVYLVLSFQYDIEELVEAKMKSLTVFKFDTPNGLGYVDAYGSLVLKQRDPIENNYKEKTFYNVNPLQKVLNDSLTTMYTSYQQRIETTEFQGHTIIQPYGGSNEAKIRIEMLIPEKQKILYNPSVLEALKSAWIQYIFVLVPLYYILIRYVLRFLLRHQIIKSYISNNLPQEKDKRWYRKFREIAPTRT
jgi:hypothetical protein